MAKKRIDRKSLETMFLGDEPIIKGKRETVSQVVAAFNWYHSTCDQGKAATFLLDYLRKIGRDGSVIARVEAKSSKIPKTAGFMARMISNGYIPSPDEVENFRTAISTLLSAEVEDDADDDDGEESSRRSHSTDARRELIGMLETELDKASDLEFKTDFNPSKWISANNIPRYQVRAIADYYNGLAIELGSALAGVDPDLTEAYRSYTKPVLKRYKAFVDGIIEACREWDEMKKAARKPRVKKIKPVEKILEKVQYQERCDEFGLVSVDPSKIIGSKEAWVFNTRYRKVTIMVAVDTLTIEGTTVKGLDEKATKSKRIRKPKEFFEAGLSKRSLTRSFAGLKTKEDEGTGRLGKDTVIMAVF